MLRRIADTIVEVLDLEPVIPGPRGDFWMDVLRFVRTPVKYEAQRQVVKTLGFSVD